MYKLIKTKYTCSIICLYIVIVSIFMCVHGGEKRYVCNKHIYFVIDIHTSTGVLEFCCRKPHIYNIYYYILFN